MSSEQFMRRYTLKAGQAGKKGIVIGDYKSAEQDALHVAFSIEKADEENPNNAKVQIWNLSKKSLSTLEKKNCRVELKAGYGDTMALVLAGTVSSVVTAMDNADRMTEVEVVDGLVQLQNTVISLSINGKVNCKTLYQKVCKAMGVAVKFGKGLKFKTMPHGFSFAGKAKTALQKIAKYCGHKWTIQNEIVQITMPGKTISTRGYLLQADSGLIGIPKKITISTGTSSTSKIEKTGWEVEYLLNGAIGVNDLVKLKSSVVNGYFRVHKVTIDGDNMEGDWICTAQLLKVAS